MTQFPRAFGSYALLVELAETREMRVGGLGQLRFDSPFYLYLGSAFGPGGLAARLRHHLSQTATPRWHIDYLRSIAEIKSIWTTRDTRRMECAWCAAASRMRGAFLVPGFGSSDCGCSSHLVALTREPRPGGLRRLLSADVRDCRAIEVVLGAQAR